MQHVAVFNKEIIENLQIKPDGTYVDLTLGAGGHSKSILEKLTSGRLISFDVDPEAIKSFENISDKATLVNANFADLRNELNKLEVVQVDGIIADLGWSSDQLEHIPGLSHSRDGKLDMRFDPNLNVTAADLLNALGKSELERLFSENADFYGKELRQLVDKIISSRSQRRIETTEDLLKIINSVFTSAANAAVKPGGVATRVFQALRIAVNSELSTLQSMLSDAFTFLSSGGHLLVITFHSGEEKIVQNAFNRLVSEASAEYLFKNKFLVPSVDELRLNLRARSAKLWGIKKL